jgi:hypothetical protein
MISLTVSHAGVVHYTSSGPPSPAHISTRRRKKHIVHLLFIQSVYVLILY